MGGITLKNPTNGVLASISSEGQLHTISESLSVEHYISRFKGDAYQVEFIDTGITNTTNSVGFIKNNSTTQNLVVISFKVQTIGLSGGTSLPDDGTYWEFGYGDTYTSDGTLVTPTNSNRARANVADVTAYEGDPTLDSGGLTFDRLYPSAGQQVVYEPKGSIILGTNDTMTFNLITDHTSGTAYTQMSFLMMDSE